MPIITLPEPGYRSVSAERRSRHWIKILTGVDTTEANGWAFLGTFVNFGETVEVDNGSWFLSYKEDVKSTGRLNGREIALYQVREEELAKVEAWTLDESPGWALKVRDRIAARLTGPAAVGALVAEREALAARLSQIDALLATAGKGE